MYEAYFGMRWRPFRAAPDPNCFISVADFSNHLQSILNCLTNGQGIAVLTAPAGSGKTVLCRRVVAELENAYHTIFIGNSHFDSPAALLQSLLHQLAESYLQMTEQELRLAIKSAISSLSRDKEALILVLDESHLLEAELLEELRVLTDITRDSVPSVRLLLSGQLELEETLSTPTASAFSQRVRCQIVLSPLRRQEAAEYVIQQLERSGAVPTQILTDEALELICHASDGSPRCLNQLCDHCLNLAFVAKQTIISPTIVRQAVDDLKQLPLRWNELPVAINSSSNTESIQPTQTYAPVDEHHASEAADDNQSAPENLATIATPPQQTSAQDSETVPDPTETFTEGEHVSQSDSYAIEFGAGIPMDTDTPDASSSQQTEAFAPSETLQHEPTADPAADCSDDSAAVVFEFGCDTDDQHRSSDPHDSDNAALTQMEHLPSGESDRSDEMTDDSTNITPTIDIETGY